MPRGEGLKRFNRQRAEKLQPAVVASVRELVTGAEGATVGEVAARAGVRSMDVGLVLAAFPELGFRVDRSVKPTRVVVDAVAPAEKELVSYPNLKAVLDAPAAPKQEPGDDQPVEDFLDWVFGKSR